MPCIQMSCKQDIESITNRIRYGKRWNNTDGWVAKIKTDARDAASVTERRMGTEGTVTIVKVKRSTIKKNEGSGK